MIELVTLAKGKGFLRVGSDNEDVTIAMLIGAATDAVVTLANGWFLLKGEPISDRICLAVLARVAVACNDWEMVTGADGETHLLAPLRLLTV